MEIHSQEDYSTASQFHWEIDSFWLGANDIQEESNWIWDSNQEQVNLNEFWSRGRPTDRPDRNCLEMSTFGMYDWYCTSPRRSVCEFY